MNLRQIHKSLRREAVRQPKKAVVLGLLGIVALWFWSPLLWGWIFGSEDIRPVASADQEIAILPTLDSTSRSLAKKALGMRDKSSSKPQQTWKELIEEIEADSQMLAATAMPGTRDPFVPYGDSISKATPGPEKVVVQQNMTPENLGLVLSATAVGSRRQTAQINGKAAEAGATISARKDGVDYVFELVEVQPQYVVLEREGRRFELTIPGQGNSELVEITNDK